MQPPFFPQLYAPPLLKMSHVHWRCLRIVAGDIWGRLVLEWILFWEFKEPLKDLSFWVLWCSSKLGFKINWWQTLWASMMTASWYLVWVTWRVLKPHLIHLAPALPIGRSGEGMPFPVFLFLLSLSVSALPLLVPSLFPHGKISIMLLPPGWQAHFLQLTALKITSKEQTVTTERQGPGGREEVGLISGIFQFLSDRKESLMCRLLLFPLDLGWCQYLCKTKWGREERHGVEINVTKERKCQKKVFFPLLLSAGTLFLLHWCKMLSVSFFFWMMEVNVLLFASYNFWKCFMQAAVFSCKMQPPALPCSKAGKYSFRTKPF